MEAKQRKIIQKFGNLFDNLHNSLYLESIEFSNAINQIRGLYVQLGTLTDDEESITALVQENQKLKEQLAVAKKDIEQMNEYHRAKNTMTTLYDKAISYISELHEFIDVTCANPDARPPIRTELYNSLRDKGLN